MCLCPCLLLCCVLVCVCPCLCLCLCGVRSRSGGQEPEGSGRKGRPVRTTSFPVKRNASSQTNLFLLNACRLVGWLVLWLVGWLAGWLVGCLGCSRLGRALVRPGRELVIYGLSFPNNKPHGPHPLMDGPGTCNPRAVSLSWEHTHHNKTQAQQQGNTTSLTQQTNKQDITKQNKTKQTQQNKTKQTKQPNRTKSNKSTPNQTRTNQHTTQHNKHEGTQKDTATNTTNARPPSEIKEKERERERERDERQRDRERKSYQNVSCQTNLFLLSACRLVGWLVGSLVSQLVG